MDEFSFKTSKGTKKICSKLFKEISKSYRTFDDHLNNVEDTLSVRSRSISRSYVLSKLQGNCRDPESVLAAVGLKSNCEELYLYLAEEYLRTGQAKLALEASDLALAKNPSSGSAKIFRMLSLLVLDKLPDLDREIEGLSGAFSTTRAVKAIKRDLASLRSDFEYALLIASEMCEDDPKSSNHLTAFRSIYLKFISHEDCERVNEFHEAVGIRIPLSSVPIRSTPSLRSSAQVDIIIPVHNGLNHITTCLSRLLKEVRNDVQKIILIDDGSGEATTNFLEDIAVTFDQVILIRSERQRGFTDALTLGITVSTAPLFVALNSDTITESDWLEKLLHTFNSSPNVGMVGPLSNSAAWQNLSSPFSTDGSFQKHPTPSDDQIKHINDTLSLNKDMNYPYSPLVHGFCALVNRDAYDKVGGLDNENFPRGYGEFQDLSLRLWDAGYEQKIATHCFVAHVGFGSIDPSIGSDLSLKARQTLYRKHSALRYLVAESASAFSSPLRNLREWFEN